MLDLANPKKVAKLAEKKKQGPIGMQCVDWHMRDGKPWRCARFRPPEKPKPTDSKPKRPRRPSVAKRKPVAAKPKPKPKG